MLQISAHIYFSTSFYHICPTCFDVFYTYHLQKKNSYYLHKTVCFVFCVVRNSYTQSVGKMQNLFNVQAGGLYTVELGYDAVGLCDTSAIALHILWYQQFPHKARAFLPRLVRHTVDHLPRL
jgi:hypothetical protein